MFSGSMHANLNYSTLIKVAKHLLELVEISLILWSNILWSVKAGLICGIKILHTMFTISKVLIPGMRFFTIGTILLLNNKWVNKHEQLNVFQLSSYTKKHLLKDNLAKVSYQNTCKIWWQNLYSIWKQSNQIWAYLIWYIKQNVQMIHSIHRC